MRDGIHYKCDDCGAEAVFKSYNKARDTGWAVKKNYKGCWCPIHAPLHRKGNAKKANSKVQKKLQRIMQIGVNG